MREGERWQDETAGGPQWLRPGRRLPRGERSPWLRRGLLAVEELLQRADLAPETQERLTEEACRVACAVAAVALGARRGLLPRPLTCPRGWLSALDGCPEWRALGALLERLREGGPVLGELCSTTGLDLLRAGATPLLDERPPTPDALATALTLLLPGEELHASGSLAALHQLLLDHAPTRSERERCLVRRRGALEAVAPAQVRAKETVVERLPGGRLFLERWRGARKGAGAFYTPPEMVRAVTRSTLEAWGRTVHAEPRVIDPAMGGGAFLIEALDQLAPARAGDDDASVAQGATEARAELARRCLRGVDSNRLAVEVAQAELWLAIGQRDLVATEGLPGLRWGDSLIGRGPRGMGAEAAPPGETPPLDWRSAFPDVFDAAAPDGGGFDLVLGNPPWDMLKALPADVFARLEPGLHRLRRAEARARVDQLRRNPAWARVWDRYRAAREANSEWLRSSERYPSRGHGDLASHRLFFELCLDLLRPGGALGLVLPGGITSDSGWAPLRRRLLSETTTLSLRLLRNRGIFPIHRSWRIALLVARAEPPASDAAIAVQTGLERLEQLTNEGQDAPDAVSVPLRLIRAGDDDQLRIPEPRSPEELQLLARLRVGRPRLGGPGPRRGRVSFCRELDMSLDARLFRPPAPGRLPLWEGKAIHQYRLDLRPPRYGVDAEDAEARVRPRGNLQHHRVAYRAVGRSTDRWTGIAALLPPGAPAGNSLHVLRAEGVPVREQLYVVALLNSFVLNYLLRRQVRANLSMYHVAGLPWVEPEEGAVELVDTIVANAAWLCAQGAGGRLDSLPNSLGVPGPSGGALDAVEALQRRAELEAAVATRYGLSLPELESILAEFGAADPALIEATIDALRDRVAQAARRAR